MTDAEDAKFPERTTADYAGGSERSGETTAKDAKTAKSPDAGFLLDPRPPTPGPRQ